MFLLKRDIVSKDTVKNFARDLESLKYCSALFLITIIFSLFTGLSQAQGSIVVAGNNSETFGEVFMVMQTTQEEVEEEVSLSIPKFQVPVEAPKTAIKKKGLFEKIIGFIKNLINKKQ